MAIRFEEFVLDLDRRQLLRGGEEIHLSPKALLLVQILVERRPSAVSRQDLYDALWPQTYVAESNLASLVRELRSTLGDDSKAPRFIRTVHGFGYAFCGEVDDEPALTSAPYAILVWGSRTIPLRKGKNVLGKPWMHYSGMIESGDSKSSQRVDEIVYGHKE